MIEDDFLSLTTGGMTPEQRASWRRTPPNPWPVEREPLNTPPREPQIVWRKPGT